VTGAATVGAAVAAAGALLTKRWSGHRHALRGLSDADERQRLGEREREPVEPAASPEADPT
jgi:hypothetical protein